MESVVLHVYLYVIYIDRFTGMNIWVSIDKTIDSTGQYKGSVSGVCAGSGA